MAERNLRPLQDPARPNQPYAADDDGLIWNQQTRGGVSPVRIANFTATITADRELHDGAEVVRSFELEVKIRGRTERVTVPIQQFRDGSWVLEQLGGEAIVEAVPRSSDHLAAGIQHLSGEIPKRIAYAHTGWACIDGAQVYLTSTGGIGPDGPVDVEVELPEALRGFALPQPPSGDELNAAIRTSLDLLRLGPETVMFPVLAAIYRAPLGSLNVVVFIVGQTGSLKTAVAAVAQQHYGSGLDAHHLPLSFTDTANALEGELFLLKDVVAVIDDFAPGGTRTDMQRAHRDADRVFRSAANGQGRRRMRADATIRPVKPPRALILATGEDLPQGHSIRARTHAIQIDPNTIDTERLTEMQRHADSGLLSVAMAGYIQWVSVQRDNIAGQLKAEITDLRDEARGATSHRRPVESAASLALGLRYFLRFAEQEGAITAPEHQDLWDRGWSAILNSTTSQEQHHQDADPVTRFVGLLNSALVAGTAHIADDEGHAPNDRRAWGWRDGSFDAEPHGRRVGWVQGDNVYLDRDSAYATVQKLANEAGESLPIAASTLGKRLHERGLLASTEQQGRGTLTVRRILEGTRRSVLHLHAATLRPTDDRPSQQPELTRPATTTTRPTIAPPRPAGHEQRSGQVGQSGQGKKKDSCEADDGTQLALTAGPTSPREPDQPDQTDQPAPCPYEAHRETDWTSIAGLRVCGTCHPPARPDLVAARASEASTLPF